MSKWTFSTKDIRGWQDPQPKNFKSFITDYPASCFPIGLTTIDIKGGSNPRIRAFADNVTPADSTFLHFKADFHLDTWLDTCLYGASCTWLDISRHSKDFQFGTFTTGQLSKDSKIMLDVQFDRWHYDSPPKVVVWLSSLDFKDGLNFRIFRTAANITTTGFKLLVGTWLDTIVYAATVHWIAVPSDKPGFAAGTFEPDMTAGTRSGYNTRIPFDKPFKRPPRVLVALSKVDVSYGSGLRLSTYTKGVTKDGMELFISTWSGGNLYYPGASYIAIEEPPHGKSDQSFAVPSGQIIHDALVIAGNNMAD